MDLPFALEGFFFEKVNGSVTNYSAEVWCSVGQWMWIETVVHNVLINKPECVHYDDVVVNEII